MPRTSRVARSCPGENTRRASRQFAAPERDARPPPVKPTRDVRRQANAWLARRWAYSVLITAAGYGDSFEEQHRCDDDDEVPGGTRARLMSPRRTTTPTESRAGPIGAGIHPAHTAWRAAQAS